MPLNSLPLWNSILLTQPITNLDVSSSHRKFSANQHHVVSSQERDSAPPGLIVVYITCDSPASLRYLVALDDPAFVCCQPLFGNSLVAILRIILNMASQSSPHLQIINTVPNGTGVFPQFTRLPLELRSMVWEQSLCRERLIRVELRPGSSPEHLYEDQERTVRKQAEASLQLSESFLIVLRNRHEISKLLRVCSESRQAALRFYRVQVPCYYKQLGSPPIEGTFISTRS